MRSWVMTLITGVFVVWGCSDVGEKPLVISTDTWIGASPLYYAHAMGWLKEANIELLQTETIEENLNDFETGASDVVTGTVHEYFRLKATHTDLIPIIAYDRSYGGDVVLSNRTVKQLQETRDKIDVYVELDTVSEDMLNYFLKEHNLSRNRMIVYDRSQAEIEQLSGDVAMIAITYNPHDVRLKEHGFEEVASSKNDHYVVVDSVFTTRSVRATHEQQLKVLKMVMAKSVEAYHRNPKAFYTVVKPYLGDISYAEFEQMRSNIQWIIDEPMSPVMKAKLIEMNYPLSEMIE